MTIREAVVRLSPWTHHHRTCARAASTGEACDCGLQAALLDIIGPPFVSRTELETVVDQLRAEHD